VAWIHEWLQQWAMGSSPTLDPPRTMWKKPSVLVDNTYHTDQQVLRGPEREEKKCRHLGWRIISVFRAACSCRTQRAEGTQGGAPAASAMASTKADF
jgi:hypothetical protein